MKTEVKAPQHTTVLVTGISGFLARHVALAAAAEGLLRARHRPFALAQHRS